MRQDNERPVAARRRRLAVCTCWALAVSLAALIASGTANAQRFQGGAGSPDPGMGGTTGSPGIGNTGPLGGGTGAADRAGVGVPIAPGASAVPGTTASPSMTLPPTGNTVLAPLPPARVSGATPLGAGSPVVGSGSAVGSPGSLGLGSIPSGSTPLSSGTMGSSGLGGTSLGLGGTPLRNDAPILGGSQPPSNPACGTLTAATSCAAGH